MKQRIEELKKFDFHDLKHISCRYFKFGVQDVIEVVSARMWEKAVKECFPLVIKATAGVQGDRLCSETYWLAYYATPTEKLICAIVALENEK